MRKSIFKALFFVLIALFALKALNIDFSPQRSTLTSPAKKINNSQAKAKPSTTPTQTATPEPAPTPTPVPLGYCLNVPVLMYHHIQPQADAASNKQTSVSADIIYFEQQLAYLNDHGYVSITSLDLVNALKNHTGLPAKSVVVTFDDGYSDIYTNVFPLIKRYNIRVSIMLSTGLVGNPGYVTWEQLNEMKNSGLVYFVNHTWSHFSVQGDLEKIKYEIDTAKTQIEQNLGQKVDLFAYPYGTFTSTEIQVLNEKNYLGAFSTIPGSYQCDSFIMTLHRTRVGNSQLSYYGL